MIRLEGLVKRFAGRAVVDGIDLQVEPGELLVLLGPSGCGKTTTLKLINRLLEPDAGRVWIDGRDAGSLPPALLRRSIGYVFQGIGLFPHLTVARNVGVVGELLGWSREELATRVDELLELVGLPPGEFRDRMPAGLSGGQQQRVGVARALCARPRLMLLDEPFGALDPLTRDRLQEEFRAIHRRLNVTAVFVTHDVTEALLLAGRIAVMRAGGLAQVGTPAELLRSPADRYVADLLEAPKRNAARLGELAGAPDADA